MITAYAATQPLLAAAHLARQGLEQDEKQFLGTGVQLDLGQIIAPAFGKDVAPYAGWHMVSIEQRVDAILNHGSHPHQEYSLTDDFAEAGGLDSPICRHVGSNWRTAAESGLRVDGVGLDLGRGDRPHPEGGASSTCTTLSLATNQSYITRQVDSTLQEVSRAARSIRVLADYLERHPDALLRGKKEESK